MNLIESCFGDAWRDLKVSEQEVPNGILALDEMPIGTTWDEHQTVVVRSSEDVHTSRHKRASRSYVERFFPFAQCASAAFRARALRSPGVNDTFSLRHPDAAKGTE